MYCDRALSVASTYRELESLIQLWLYCVPSFGIKEKGPNRCRRALFIYIFSVLSFVTDDTRQKPSTPLIYVHQISLFQFDGWSARGWVRLPTPAYERRLPIVKDTKIRPVVNDDVSKSVRNAIFHAQRPSKSNTYVYRWKKIISIYLSWRGRSNRTELTPEKACHLSSDV